MRSVESLIITAFVRCSPAAKLAEEIQVSRKPQARDHHIVKELELAEERAALRHASEWQAIEAEAEFQKLISAKRRFIIPATVFFILYYFALPVMVGYWPGLMETNVIGSINLAYLFALSQFVMAWVLSYLYVREAGVFDRMAARIVKRVKGVSE
jgi:uncharacterized membrane protein (DUF485 family)